MYGHVETLAQEIKKGADSVEGVEAKLWQVCINIKVQFNWNTTHPLHYHIRFS